MDGIVIFFAVLMAISILIWIVAICNRRKSDEMIAGTTANENDGIIIRMQRLPGGAIRSLSTMWILVELDDGSRHKFIVRADNDFVVGDVGHLHWQGERIMSFKRIAHCNDYV